MISIKTNQEKRPFSQQLPLILSFVLPILVMFGIFVGKSIFPFGEKSFLRTDLYHQYAPFFRDLLERLKNGQSLTYAWEVGLGSNYVALTAYYLSSPFNLLLLLCPSSFLIEFVTYLIVVKIGLCGLSMTYYLSEKFRTRHLSITFFGLCYALSGYLAAYSWNIMWLDCLWLAPLIILGLEKLVKENHPFTYCITLALAILTNYYIAIMLCLFMVLYFICLMIMLPKQTAREYEKKVGLFALFSLIAGGISAVFVVPAAYALMTTASADTTFPSSLISYFSIIEMLARHLVNVETEIGLEHWPNLYCGVASLLFLPMYYLNQRISYKEKIVKTSLLFVLLLSFSLNIPNYIWHGFHFPNSLPCRQSFLYTIVLLTMCYEGFRGIAHISRGKLVGCFWGVTAFILIAEKIIDAEEFSYSVFYISLLFVALYTLFLYLYRIGKLKLTTALILMTTILVGELGLNTTVTSVSVTSRTEYLKNTSSYQELIDVAEEEADTLFYRMEKVSRKTKNDGAWLGYSSASIFSSTTNANVSELYKKLGLEGNTNAYSFTGATPFTSSLLSVRYLLSSQELDDSKLYELVESIDGVYLYKNLYTLSLGFMIPSDTDELWEYADTNPAKAQNALISLTTDAGDILTSIAGTTSGTEYTTTVSERSHVYVYVENSKVDNVTATVDGVTQSFSNVKRRYLLDLGYCEAGAQITLSNSDDETMTATAYVFNEENFISAYEILSEQSLEVDTMTDTLWETSITGHITVASDGLLFTSIPYENGWSVYVDGELAEVTTFADTFLAVSLTAGEHTITLRYLPEGLIMGAIISGVSLLLLVSLWAVLWYLRRKKTALANGEEEESANQQEENTSVPLPNAQEGANDPDEATMTAPPHEEPPAEEEAGETVPEGDKNSSSDSGEISSSILATIQSFESLPESLAEITSRKEKEETAPQAPRQTPAEEVLEQILADLEQQGGTKK